MEQAASHRRLDYYLPRAARIDPVSGYPHPCALGHTSDLCRDLGVLRASPWMRGYTKKGLDDAEERCLEFGIASDGVESPESLRRGMRAVLGTTEFREKVGEQEMDRLYIHVASFACDTIAYKEYAETFAPNSTDDRGRFAKRLMFWETKAGSRWDVPIERVYEPTSEWYIGPVGPKPISMCAVIPPNVMKYGYGPAAPQVRTHDGASRVAFPSTEKWWGGCVDGGNSSNRHEARVTKGDVFRSWQLHPRATRLLVGGVWGLWLASADSYDHIEYRARAVAAAIQAAHRFREEQLVAAAGALVRAWDALIAAEAVAKEKIAGGADVRYPRLLWRYMMAEPELELAAAVDALQATDT